MKRIQFISNRLFGDLHEDNWLVIFFLSVIVGLFTLMVVIALFLPGGIQEQEETYIFVLGWVLALSMAILSIPALLWLRSRYFSQSSNALLALLAANSILFALIITGINLAGRIMQASSLAVTLTYLSIPVIILVNLLMIFALTRMKMRLPALVLGILTVIGTLGFMNFIGLFPDNNPYPIPIKLPLASLFLGIVTGGYAYYFSNKYRKTRKAGGRHPDLLDILVLGLLAIACFDPSYTINLHHQNFYLGPANRILHGGTMLVDTFSQYGILPIYFLVLAIQSHVIPFSYQGLSLLITFLWIGQFIIVYALLIWLVKDRFYSFLLFILCVLVGLFGTLGISQAFPSTGPYRFGLVYLIFASILLRSIYPSLHKACLWIEYSLVGIAILWSFETFVYVAFPYLGICLYESLAGAAPFTVVVRRFTLRITWFVLALVGAVSLFSGFTYLRAKALPDWGIYLDFIRSYSVGGICTLPISAWGPWIFPVFIYFVSLITLAFRYLYLKERKITGEDTVLLGLTLFGIAQYTYYLGRSHPNNLYHIAIPFIMILGTWLVKAMKKDDFPLLARITSQVVLFSCLLMLALVSSPSLKDKIVNNNTGLAVFRVPITGIPDREVIQEWLAIQKERLVSGSQDPQVAEARQLIDQYMPGQTQIPVILSYTNTTEILFNTNRDHSFPLSDITEDEASPKNVTRIMESPTPLKTGGYIIAPHDPSYYAETIGYYQLAISLLNKICQEFSVEEVESTAHGVSVFQLGAPTDTPGPYCEIVHSLSNQLASFHSTACQGDPPK